MIGSNKSIMYSLIEPLTKPETYQTLLSNLIMIVIYIIVAWIVLRFINKGIEQFFKIQNKGKKRIKTFSNINIISSKYRIVCGMVYSVNNHFKQVWYQC